ncbi:MAG: hypothetical protein ACI80K_004724, partial [Paracoccaceae bacterium]
PSSWLPLAVHDGSFQYCRRAHHQLQTLTLRDRLERPALESKRLRVRGRIGRRPGLRSREPTARDQPPEQLYPGWEKPRRLAPARPGPKAARIPCPQARHPGQQALKRRVQGSVGWPVPAVPQASNGRPRSRDPRAGLPVRRAGRISWLEQNVAPPARQRGLEPHIGQCGRCRPDSVPTERSPTRCKRTVKWG